MIIQRLSNKTFKSFIKWVDPKYQNINPVFVATFLHPTAGLVTAYCKLYPLDVNGRSLINEVTGYLFGHALEIPQPEHAFMAQIPTAALKDLKNKFPNHTWLHESALYPAFCTTRLDGESAAIFLNSDSTLLQNDLNKWNKLPNAVALDENIAHTDRHFNNLMRLKKYHYATIDNGRLICEYSDDWDCSMMQPQKNYRNRLSEHIWNHKPDHTQVGIMLNAADKHNKAFESIKSELLYWVNLLISHKDDRQIFIKFLEQRTGLTSCLIKDRYQYLT